MIVRVSEARVRPGMAEEFLTALTDLVESFPATYAGLLGHDVLVDRSDPLRVQYVSRWVDEPSLVAYAGEDWAITPVTFPDEERFLTGPLALEHYYVVVGI